MLLLTMFLEWGEVKFANKNFSIVERVMRDWWTAYVVDLIFVVVDLGLEITQLMKC